MVDYSELKKKFPAKKKVALETKNKKASKERIRREFQAKKELLASPLPKMKRGLVFYAVVIMGLMMLGSLVLSATGRGGKEPVSRKQVNARKSMDALAVALGRYKFHVGHFPSTEEGLSALTNITPKVKGWFGPYTKRIVPDPWGREYVYETRSEGGNPILYSCGPDGRMGSPDDIMPDQALFDEPFRDTTWTNHWVPYNLRGIVVAPDAATKKAIQEEVKKY
ncbi:MAG: type II secretion system protein GspG [Kiritimatiellae bacterium]|nr:type II secretion system protein GspG [Kiritimatiellia bacterium]